MRKTKAFRVRYVNGTEMDTSVLQLHATSTPTLIYQLAAFHT